MHSTLFLAGCSTVLPSSHLNSPSQLMDFFFFFLHIPRGAPFLGRLLNELGRPEWLPFRLRALDAYYPELLKA